GGAGASGWPGSSAGGGSGKSGKSPSPSPSLAGAASIGSDVIHGIASASTLPKAASSAATADGESTALSGALFSNARVSEILPDGSTTLNTSSTLAAASGVIVTENRRSSI